MLLLNINRKPYMGSAMTSSHLILDNLERERLFRFGSLISHKGANLGYIW